MQSAQIYVGMCFWQDNTTLISVENPHFLDNELSPPASFGESKVKNKRTYEGIIIQLIKMNWRE
jgi:hypothetical protein